MLNTVSFQCLHVEIVANTQVFEGVRHPRAHVARMVLFDTDSYNGQVRHARASGPRSLLGQECCKSVGFLMILQERAQ